MVENVNLLEKEDIIFELLLSLNRGNSGYAVDRVGMAIQQYQQLVEQGIIEE